MLLVDTSVWVDFLKAQKVPHVEYLKHCLQTGIDTAITSSIYQEVLQGSRDNKEYLKHQTYFSTLTFIHPSNPIGSYETAARIYFDCRRKGLTVRSSADCLIAQIAIEHDLTLLHNDSDFTAIAKVANDLKQTNAEKE